MKTGIVLLAIMVIVPIVIATTPTENSSQLISHLKFDNSQEKQIIHDGFLLSMNNFTKIGSRNEIPVGSIIYHQNGVTRVFDSAGKQLAIINDSNSGIIGTPSGYSPATNVYLVPNGALIKRNGETIQVIVNNKPISTIINTQSISPQVTNALNFDGWIEQAKYDNIPNLGRFSADWIVPSPPSNNGTTAHDFLFNGIMPQDTTPSGTTLIQPVLEWNNGGSYTQCNNHWCARPWYITNDGGNFTTSDFILVNSGDRITGLMDWNSNTQNWTIIVTDNTLSQSLNIDDDRFWTDNLKVTCALEGRGVNDNSDIPGTTSFTNMQFRDTNNQPVYFNWEPWYSPGIQSTFKGLFVDAPSQSTVTLFTDKNYTITPSVGQYGSISPGIPTPILANGNQTFNIFADPGYTIYELYVDDSPITFLTTNYTFSNVTTDHTITATFMPLPTDDFNDNELNSSLWTPITVGSGPSIAETNQRLEITIPSTSGETGNGYFGANVKSVFKMRGDFDVQTDYSLLTWPTRNGVRSALQAPYAIERTSFGYGDGGSNPDVYLSDFGGLAGIVSTSDQSGKIRMVRVGSQLSTYYYSGGTWVFDAQVTRNTDDTNIYLAAWSHNYCFGHVNVKIAFDNFAVNNGQVIWPEQEIASSSRKAIEENALPTGITPIKYNGTAFVTNEIVTTNGSLKNQ